MNSFETFFFGWIVFEALIRKLRRRSLCSKVLKYEYKFSFIELNRMIHNIRIKTLRYSTLNYTYLNNQKNI